MVQCLVRDHLATIDVAEARGATLIEIAAVAWEQAIANQLVGLASWVDVNMEN